MFNLKLVQQRGNLFGEVIVSSYDKEPGKVLQMIRDQYQDNPDLVTETISLENVRALGLQTALDRFKYFFPTKSPVRGYHGLIYYYKTLGDLFENLRRAKSMIRDLGLHYKLTARSISRNNTHTLYIDQL